MKRKTFILLVKQTNYIFFKKKFINGILIIDSDNYDFNNGIYLDLKNNVLSIKNTPKNYNEYEINILENRDINDGFCQDIMEWLNSMNNKKINKIEFIVKFFNILNIKKSYYIPNKISDEKLLSYIN